MTISLVNSRFTVLSRSFVKRRTLSGMLRNKQPAQFPAAILDFHFGHMNRSRSLNQFWAKPSFKTQLTENFCFSAPGRAQVFVCLKWRPSSFAPFKTKRDNDALDFICQPLTNSGWSLFGTAAQLISHMPNVGLLL